MKKFVLKLADKADIRKIFELLMEADQDNPIAGLSEKEIKIARKLVRLGLFEKRYDRKTMKTLHDTEYKRTPEGDRFIKRLFTGTVR